MFPAAGDAALFQLLGHHGATVITPTLKEDLSYLSKKLLVCPLTLSDWIPTPTPKTSVTDLQYTAHQAYGILTYMILNHSVPDPLIAAK